MKKLSLALVLGGLTLGIANLGAAPFTAESTVIPPAGSFGGGAIGFLLDGTPTGSSYTDTFNILAQFNPATQTIDSGSVMFTFTELGTLSEVDVTLQLEPISDSTFLVEGGLFFGTVEGSALVSLNATGMATFTVNWVSGVFSLDSAYLFVAGQDNSDYAGAGVPDAGSSLSLMTLGLLALSGLRKRFLA